MIGAKRVTAPDGGSAFHDAFGLAIALVVIVLILFLLTTVVFPIVVLTVELLIVIVLLVGGIAGRLIFRKPWTIRARRPGDRSELRWHASGFRRSGRVRDEIAAALGQGHTDIRPREAIAAVT